MNRDYLVDVIIEIERYTNVKWEYDRENDSLFVDRVLPYPYFYPYAYGFFPNTLGQDGDELDALILSDKHYPNYNFGKQIVKGYIVGGLMMHDEKGRDEKIFVVPECEIEQYLNKTETEKNLMRENIHWFFSNYKNNTWGKWSMVESIITYPEALNIYLSAKQNAKERDLNKSSSSSLVNVNTV